MAHIDIVFDGPPGPEAGRFIEVEDSSGKSISFGEWMQRPDGYWVLRIPGPAPLLAAAPDLLAALKLSLPIMEDEYSAYGPDEPETHATAAVRTAIAKAEGG